MKNICSNCQQPITSKNYYCSNCGASLNESPIIVSRNQNISVAGRDVTPRQLKQIGASVAVSALGLLAEFSLLYVRRRLDQMRVDPLSIEPKKRGLRRTKQNSITTTDTENQDEVVTVVRERVIEIRRWGRPMQRVIERMAWRHELKK